MLSLKVEDLDYLYCEVSTRSRRSASRKGGLIGDDALWRLLLCHTRNRELIEQNCITVGTEDPGFREDASDSATRRLERRLFDVAS